MTMRVAAGLLLAAIAAALLGFAAWQAQQRIEDLEAEVQSLGSQLAEMEFERDAFLYHVSAPDFTEQIARIARLSKAEDRATVAERLIASFDMHLAPLPEAFDLYRRIMALAAEPGSEARQVLLAEFELWIDESQSSIVLEEPFVATLESATAISTLATAAGAIASALLSVLVFAAKHGSRRLEEEMLALDVEMKRIELAKARHAARDALDAQSGI
ncbi:hypothetical protein [Mangrovicoccus sp. HB161399]|uniref:hypothetical protein n=1 Tax=Mangrovicoccus sp. HB161399 TaxID=2720392 RepID=UPI001557686F|nr:hypothetical protein [Mangrovicoccus sp. HB161399]